MNERRFSGIARLYGETALERFRSTHLVVVGVGGTGSWAVEALARSAVGKLTLIDMDHVAESNINRQLQALEETLGASKIVVLRKRIAQINPSCEVQCIDAMAEPDNLHQVIPTAADHLLDCIDGFRNKAALLAFCLEHGIPVTSTGAAGALTDPSRIKLGDLRDSSHDPLLAKTRRLLRSDHGVGLNPKQDFGIRAVWSEERAAQPGIKQRTERGGGLNCGGFGSCTPVTASFGMFAAGDVLRRLAEMS